VAQSQASRLTFWSWYRHSGRTDGALVGAPRRAFGFSIGIALLICWFVWTSRTQPKVNGTISILARSHPFCFSGIVLAFVLMSFRGIALEYLAYSVYQAQGVHLKWTLFFGIGESELRRRYEETFAKDKYLRAPACCFGLALAVLALARF
jgi:hypothetical protein